MRSSLVCCVEEGVGRRRRRRGRRGRECSLARGEWLSFVMGEPWPRRLLLTKKRVLSSLGNKTQPFPSVKNPLWSKSLGKIS